MNEKLPVNNLTSKDVADFSKEVGKDVVKQTIVWTVAAFAVKGIRDVIGKLTKSK